ncbi:ankyrin repeat domain-containing protein [Elusimicrobiota bacterium]
MTRNILISLIILFSMGLSRAGGGVEEDMAHEVEQRFIKQERYVPPVLPPQTITEQEDDFPEFLPPKTTTEKIPIVSHVLKTTVVECAYLDVENAKLVNAIRYGDLRSAKEALGCGAEVRRKINTINGATTILAFASMESNPDIVGEIIERKADINEKNIWGDTALMHATIYDRPKNIEVLTSRGANPDIANNDSETPLIRAVTDMKIPVIQALVAGGANPDFGDFEGMTALMLATENASVVKLLIYKGNANINLINAHGQTALDIATNQGHAESAMILAEAMAKQNEENK